MNERLGWVKEPKGQGKKCDEQEEDGTERLEREARSRSCRNLWATMRTFQKSLKDFRQKSDMIQFNLLKRLLRKSHGEMTTRQQE